ncbi:MAG: riboflavin biosynthesis protein RibF, partial [Firmicutes bacterium]|nr:riboflavin biosynthesis protein RibF [Candidatus Caballimonas caccae]
MLDKKVYIALGYFDSVHIGHQKVIERCKKIARENTPVVFTFKGNLKKAIGFSNGKNVFYPQERREILNNFGIDNVFFAPVSRTFLSKGKLAFLNFLNKKYDIKGYVCGVDYRFGKNGEGDATFLTEYAKQHNQTVEIVETLNIDGEKVSTSKIKEYLEKGDLKNANKLLGFDYFLTGMVFRDRQVGREIGFPTINIKTEKDRFLIKEGVYSGYMFISNKRYKTVINYGARPTFDLTGKLIEAHIIDFNGNLYGKKVKIFFTEYLREVKKFNNTT